MTHTHYHHDTHTNTRTRGEKETERERERERERARERESKREREQEREKDKEMDRHHTLCLTDSHADRHTRTSIHLYMYPPIYLSIHIQTIYLIHTDNHQSLSPVAHT